VLTESFKGFEIANFLLLQNFASSRGLGINQYALIAGFPEFAHRKLAMSPSIWLEQKGGRSGCCAESLSLFIGNIIFQWEE
jgi:hypothetical protein